MACGNSLLPANAESEMEEGEIIDDLDDLSDISSEEEFLLRQRLQVLENYNNVLERKKAKDSLSLLGKQSREDALSQDLSEISDTELEYPQSVLTKPSKGKHTHLNKQKKRKVSAANIGKLKVRKKKPNRIKKKIPIKIISESSEESEDEYRNKRRKLATAVAVTKEKSDSTTLNTTTLKARLNNMLYVDQNQKHINMNKEVLDTSRIVDSLIDSFEKSNTTGLKSQIQCDLTTVDLDMENEIYEWINLCDNEEDENVRNNIESKDCVDSVIKETKENEESSKAKEESDDDIELLRQYALNTKTTKVNFEQKVEVKPVTYSEEEDSDTAELRAICLKSALLKKAIEMKRKEKLKKRLSQSVQADYIVDLSNEASLGNNTDVESVDMDIGSDCDEKLKEQPCIIEIIDETETPTNGPSPKQPISEQAKVDEIDEDEDLLRAKLLISLSKNLPNLVDLNTNNTKLDKNQQSNTKVSKISSAPEQKPFIIRLGESDSEGEHEATKNLTKMHLKLSEQVDFQNKLDLFLKSTRMEVEKKTLPDVIQEPQQQIKPSSKFVVKAVRHLPKSEQIEYRNLYKRMAELEKIKQARQNSMNTIQSVKTMKSHNIKTNTQDIANINLEGQIAVSRKLIAEESSKMLKVKEEATKLSQKHKIVATELRNIQTAITLNKKQQRIIHNRLSKIRHQHQLLLKGAPSPSLKTSNNNLLVTSSHNVNFVSTSKLQKDIIPAKQEPKKSNVINSLRVKVVNDLKKDTLTPADSRRLVEVDVSNNNKSVNWTNNALEDKMVNMDLTSQIEDKNDREPYCNQKRDVNPVKDSNIKDSGDYKSPLEALQGDTWVEDPNSFLCPFEVGGTCKDTECKYLHPKIPIKQ